jgi:hypothetical protein
MDDVVDIIQRWIGQHAPPLWAVVLAAVALAWLERAGTLRRMRRYDAWWLFNLRPSDMKFVRRPRRRSGDPRAD